jgi:hypothetical protein
MRIECLLGLFIWMIGIASSGDPLKEAQLEKVMQTIDQVDSKPSFTIFQHRRI